MPDRIAGTAKLGTSTVTTVTRTGAIATIATRAKVGAIAGSRRRRRRRRRRQPQPAPGRAGAHDGEPPRPRPRGSPWDRSTEAGLLGPVPIPGDGGAPHGAAVSHRAPFTDRPHPLARQSYTLD